ncbi:MAG: 50S ribosomal protein L10 [Patescibacteria group bacterium]
MPNQHNQAVLEELKEKAARSKSIALVDYAGTTVNDQVELRNAVSAAGGEVRVAKNTIIKLALNQEALNESLEGMTALVFSYEDEVGALKPLVTFHKDKEKLVIKQGLLEEKVLSTAEVIKLSELPGKEELIATLISRLQGPSYGMVNVLKAGQRNLVQVLKAITEKEPAAAAA